MTCTEANRWEGKEEEERNSALEWMPSKKEKDNTSEDSKAMRNCILRNIIYFVTLIFLLISNTLIQNFIPMLCIIF